MNGDALAHLFLYSDNTLTDNINTSLLNSVIVLLNTKHQQNVLIIL